MNKIFKSNKGFTLVELLAVVVVIAILLGVSIAAVTRFIDRAREEEKSSQEKTLTMAAENYLQENRGMLPKSIGETSIIMASVLKSNKYITEDLKNSKKESCMANSYVSVYKTKSKYVYKAYLLCGSEQATSTVVASAPIINIDFVDAAGRSIEGTTSDVSDAKFVIQINGGELDGRKIAIEGYNYSILTKVTNNGELREVYNSGTISANNATDIFINHDNTLKDYIDISKPTTVAIRVSARNVEGGINEKVIFGGGETDDAQVIYYDNDPPICAEIIGQPSTNSWIKAGQTGERVITVVCSDGNGSGCIRSKFTKTWDGSTSYEKDVIQIKDNKGNVTNCEVRVNIDKQYPNVSVEAYARDSDGNPTGSNVLKTVQQIKENQFFIQPTSDYYKNLNSSNYMTSANYPYGVVYKITITENASIGTSTWQVNKPGITSTSDSNYETVITKNGQYENASFTTCSGKKTCTVYAHFNQSGMRKGALTIKDKAGNKTTYGIYANLS